MLGLELQDDRAIAVSLDETGRLLGRASLSSADLATAALSAIDGASARAAEPAGPLGVAAIDPDSPNVDAVIALLARRFAGPFLEHGAVRSGAAAAVGETWIGAARGVRDVAFLAVDEHVTAGVIRDGVPAIGAHGRAADVAWLSLNPVEREDYRKAGCLETEVAAAGIVRRLVWRIKAGDESMIQAEVGGDLSAIRVGHVLEAARRGDGVAISVVRDTAKYVGMAAGNLVAITDPAVLVLGGAMGAAADPLLELVRVELTRRIPAAMMQALSIVPAALGAEAAAIGAARLAAGSST